jgi:hypothetical protein
MAHETGPQYGHNDINASNKGRDWRCHQSATKLMTDTGEAYHSSCFLRSPAEGWNEQRVIAKQNGQTMVYGKQKIIVDCTTKKIDTTLHAIPNPLPRLYSRLG